MPDERVPAADVKKLGVTSRDELFDEVGVNGGGGHEGTDGGRPPSRWLESNELALGAEGVGDVVAPLESGLLSWACA